MFKATLRAKQSKPEAGGENEDEDSDWESEEEDFPHVRLDELLDNLTLEEKPKRKPVVDSDEEETKQ